MLDWLSEFQIFFSRVLCQFQHVYGCQVMKIWHIATCPRFSYKIWLKSKIKRWHYFNQDMLDWLSEFQIFFSRVLCQFQHVYGCQVMKIWHIATCPRFSYKIWLKSKIKRWHYFNQDMLDWLSEFQIFFFRVLCQFQHVYGCQVMKNWHWATCPSCSSKWKLHTRKTSLWSRHDAEDENRIEIMFWLSWSSQCEK